MRIKLLFLFFTGLAMASRDTASSSLPITTTKKFESVTDHADYVSIDPHYSSLKEQIPVEIKGSSEDVGSSHLSPDMINRYRSFKKSANSARSSRLSPNMINQYRSFKKESADIINHPTDPSHSPPTLHENMPSRRKRSISTDSISLLRLRRSSNDAAFSTLQSRVAALARVVTGVSLYNGLVDKSISPDQAITELMNLGSIQLKDLETFDSKKVDAFVTLLRDTSNKMNTPSTLIEKQIVDLYTMKNVWNGSKNFETIPDEASYKGLQYLENLDLTVLENFKAGADSQKSLESLTNAAKTVVDAIEKGNALKTLKQMTPFHQFAQLVEHYSNSKPGDIKFSTPAETASLKTNLQMLQEFSSKTEVFSTLSRIASSGMEASTNRMHTSGFINGHRDLSKLSNDAGDAWLHSSLGTVDLKEGLSVFTGLAEKMSALDETWNGARTKTIRRSLQTAGNLEYYSNFVKYNPDSLDTAFQSFKKFPTDSPRLTGSLKGLSKDLIKLLKVVEVVYSISRSRSLESSKTHLSLLRNAEKVKDVVGRIMQQSTFYAGILTDLQIKDYKEFFDFLKKLNEDFTSLSVATQFVIDLRNLQNEQSFDTDISTASSAVSGSSKHISTIRSKIEEITKSETGKKLVEFKELEKFSKPLGDSSEALSRVQKVLEKKKALLDFVENGHLVEEAVELLRAPLDQFEVRKGWTGFDELSSKILNQLDKMQKWIDGLVESEELDSYGSALEKLSGLGDVDLEMNRRLAAVDFLQQQIDSTKHKSTVDEVVKFKETISRLESLNLEFSKFDASLSTMSSTLTGLKNVGGKEVDNTTMAAGLLEEKAGLGLVWCIIIAAGIVVIGLIIAGIWCGWFKKCLNKMKGKRKRRNRTTPSVPPKPLPAGPVTPNTGTGKKTTTTTTPISNKKVVKPPSTGKSKVAQTVAKPTGNNKSGGDNKNNKNSQKNQTNQKNQNTKKTAPSSSKKNKSERGNNSNRKNQKASAPVAPPAGSNRSQRNSQNNRAPVTVQPGLEVPDNEYSARNKSSYFESQSDDDTLRCVKSITNGLC